MNRFEKSDANMGADQFEKSDANMGADQFEIKRYQHESGPVW